MFGHTYFGARHYGPRYYGPAGVITDIAGPWVVTVTIDDDTSGCILVRQKGDRIAIKAVFRNLSGSRVDPDEVTLLRTTPSGVTAEVSLTRQTVGEYRGDVDLTEAGRWFFRVEGTGLSSAAEIGQFMVEPNAAFVVTP